MANRSHRPGSSPADEYRRTKRKRLRASLCGAASIQEPTVGLEPTTCGLQTRSLPSTDVHRGAPVLKNSEVIVRGRPRLCTVIRLGWHHGWHQIGRASCRERV